MPGWQLLKFIFLAAGVKHGIGAVDVAGLNQAMTGYAIIAGEDFRFAISMRMAAKVACLADRQICTNIIEAWHHLLRPAWNPDPKAHTHARGAPYNGKLSQSSCFSGRSIWLRRPCNQKLLIFR